MHKKGKSIAGEYPEDHSKYFLSENNADDENKEDQILTIKMVS